MDKLVDKVTAGQIQPYRASVAAQLVNTKIRLLEFERNLKETMELEEKVAALEELAEATGRPRERRRTWYDTDP